jgi:hypothetical protein
MLRQRESGGLFATAKFDRIFGVRELQIERFRAVPGELQIDMLRLAVDVDVQRSGPGDLRLG